MNSRIAAHLIALVAVAAMAHAATADLGRANDNVEPAARPSMTVEQAAVLEWAYERFSNAGLDFPDVQFRFHDGVLACDGHVGWYHPSTRTLELCRLDGHTVLHELAHAWAHSSLGSESRSAFLELRGLDEWNDEIHPWHELGTEHAAEIMAWALFDRNTLVPWRDASVDGQRAEQGWRLLTIPDSDPDSLIAGYEALTGTVPVDRISDDPRMIVRTTIASPEADRVRLRSASDVAQADE